MFSTIITGFVSTVITTPELEERGRAMYSVAQTVVGQQWPVRITVFGPAALAEEGQMVRWIGSVSRGRVRGTESDYVTNVNFVAELSQEGWEAIESVVHRDATAHQMAMLAAQKEAVKA